MKLIGYLVWFLAGLLPSIASAGLVLEIDEATLLVNGNDYSVDVIMRLDPATTAPKMSRIVTTFEFSEPSASLQFRNIAQTAGPDFFGPDTRYRTTLIGTDAVRAEIYAQPLSVVEAYDLAKIFQLQFSVLPGAPNQFSVLMTTGMATNYTPEKSDFPLAFDGVNSLLIVSAVPEPSSAILCLLAVGGSVLARRRQVRGKLVGQEVAGRALVS